MFRFDESYCINTFRELLSADSTTGQYEEVQRVLTTMLDELGYPYEVTHKGGVIADLGGAGNPLLVSAHLDDIGL
ncbi:MAG: osmoprotectant NAGGN system M42 family peptidase, partial [Clostridia bacterium]|nr:osmoprotectant NAGGN system M42 family peptidase [Clostridia bacterium]